jgi:hypothetical protein
MLTLNGHVRLKTLSRTSMNSTTLVPGAGLEPARTLPGPRDFKSRVSTNSTIRAQPTEIELIFYHNYQPLENAKASQRREAFGSTLVGERFTRIMAPIPR